MNSFAGTGTLTRFALRRDRLRLTIWALALTGTTAATVPALDQVFTSEADRAARAALMRTPTGVIFGGPGYGLEDYTLGPMVVNELLMSLLIALAVMNILGAVRHTRAEEETGRAELLRAGVTGRRAAGTAAMVVAVVSNAIIGALTAAVLVGSGLPAADSIAIGAGILLTGLTFAALAAACAQVVSHARTAIGLGMVGLGVIFMIRVIGDIAEQGGSALSWASPMAWVFQTRAYVDLRWWPLLLYVPAVLALTAITSALATRRDLGAGLVPPRAGRATAGRFLSGPLGLHLRLQRGSLITWTVATVALGVAFGSLADQLAVFLEESPEMIQYIGADPTALTDSFFAAMMQYVAMLAGAATILSVLRLRAEESAGRAEVVLATATSRVRWMGGAMLTALLIAVVTMLAGGLSMGAAADAVLEDTSYTGVLTLSALNMVVVPVLFGAVAALCYGLDQRLLPLLWLWFVASILITIFGPILELPAWSVNISALEHPAFHPAEESVITPLAIMGGAAIVAALGALAAYRRRDLVTG